MNISIRVGSTELSGELFETELGRKIADMLPIESVPHRWGDEIYFDIGLDHSLENEREEVDVGDLAYWPPGKAFCIFYGSTPASRGNEPRAASAVEVFGRVTGDARQLKKERGGEVRITRA